MEDLFENGEPVSFIRRASTRVEEAANVYQLYALFLKLRHYFLDPNLAGVFDKRLDFLKRNAVSQDDIDKCEELEFDIMAEMDIDYSSSITSDQTFETDEKYQRKITLAFNTSNGGVLEDVKVSLVKLACDKFSGNRHRMCAFLGMTHKDLKALLDENRALRKYLTHCKRESKRN